MNDVMKKLHIIHAKNINQTSKSSVGKLLPVLEKETLSWAKKAKKKAHKATLELKSEFESNPKDDKTKNKYKILNHNNLIYII